MMMFLDDDVTRLKRAYILLSTYRGLALGAAVLQIWLFKPLSSMPEWLMFAFAVIYSLYKFSRRSPLYNNNVATHIDLGVDLALSVALLWLTEGLSSQFLFYSLSPILSASLLLPKKLTFSITGMLVLSLISGQLLLNQNYPEFMVNHQLVFGLSLYGLISFLIASLPYLVNANVYQNIRHQAITQERNRMSQELHDGVTQSLGILRWKTEALSQSITSARISSAIRQVDEIKDILLEAEKEARQTITELRTSPRGFAATLAQYAAEFSHNYGIKCKLVINDKVNLSSAIEQQLLLITKEALTNVRKHAKAHNVKIMLQANNGTIEMVIRDDGKGISSMATSAGGYGLTIMEERARELGGELSAYSCPDQGTEIRVRIGLSSETGVIGKADSFVPSKYTSTPDLG